MVMTAILIVVMSYEMVVRRGFDSPTLWAFDISYMLSGVIFVAAVPYALLRNEHVRIDFPVERACRSACSTPPISCSTRRCSCRRSTSSARRR